MRIAGKLMSDGHILVAMEKDRKNPKYNVFVFKESDAIKTRLQELKKEKSHR